MNIDELNYELNVQKNNLKILLECLKNINSVIQDTDNFESPKEIIELLKDTKTNLDNTRSNISNLETLKKHLDDLDLQNADETKENNYNELSTTYKEIINKTYKNFNNFIFRYIRTTTFSINEPTLNSTTQPVHTVEENPSMLSVDNIDEMNKDKPTENETKLDEEIKNIDVNTQGHAYEDNKVLLISETQGKIILPYSIKDLNEILEKDKTYSNLQEIIDDKYTLPFDKYKSPAISRFKEAYNLMRKKEKAPITESLDLALELTFNSLLNPAIITACKNLDELDIYLDCLDSNELDKFDIFEIKYEFLPRKTKF